MSDVEQVEQVLTYWFEPEPKTKADVEAKGRLWFGGGQKLDAEIESKFGALVQQARSGSLDGWAETTRGALALVILIDQFSRNVYRGSPLAFAADEQGLALARAIYDSGRYRELGLFERLFASMPFRHVERLEEQKRGVALAVEDALTAPPELKDFLVYSVDFARKHLDVIARFGRFPHRNQVLGRESTAEERTYLDYLAFAGQWL